MGGRGLWAKEQLCSLLSKPFESWVIVASPPPKRAISQPLPEEAMEGAPGSVSLMSLSMLIRTCFPFRLLLRDGRQVRVGKKAASWRAMVLRNVGEGDGNGDGGGAFL